MTRKIWITVALLMSFNTAGAVRVLEQVERAVELTLGELTLPNDNGGTINFKECAKCPVSTHRVTNATVYRANGQTLALVDFQRLVADIRQRPKANDTTIAAVFLDIASGRVTRVQIRE
jgi:hypothetical protein